MNLLLTAPGKCTLAIVNMPFHYHVLQRILTGLSPASVRLWSAIFAGIECICFCLTDCRLTMERRRVALV